MAKISRAREALDESKPAPAKNARRDAAGERVNPGFDANSVEKAFEPTDGDTFPGTTVGPAATDSGFDLESVQAAFRPDAGEKPSAEDEARRKAIEESDKGYTADDVPAEAADPNDRSNLPVDKPVNTDPDTSGVDKLAEDTDVTVTTGSTVRDSATAGTDTVTAKPVKTTRATKAAKSADSK